MNCPSMRLGLTELILIENSLLQTRVRISVPDRYWHENLSRLYPTYSVPCL